MVFIGQGGLYPPAWKGWHFNILTRDIMPPFSIPYFIIAKREYSEHEG
jgi:hypothetical protein